MPAIKYLVTMSVMGALASSPMLCASISSAHAGVALTAADTDADGTLDKAEVDQAAGVAFDKLDAGDKDGQLERAEVKGRISKAGFAAADPDHDGKLSKDEFTAVADKYFAAADKDSDGTVDAKELHSKAGKKLARLIR